MVDKVIQDQLRDLLPYDIGHRDSFDPIIKIFNGGDNELMSIR